MINRLFIGCLLASLTMVVVHAETTTNHRPTEPTGPLAKEFSVDFAPISEMSGLVKSKRFADVYWVHNDSGDSPRLFAINRKGKVLFPGYANFYGEVPVPGKKQWPGHRIYLAAHLDWEDIAVDSEMIYIADMGNNGNARRDLGVYVIPEPNPRAVEATRTLKFLPVKYPGQKKFPADTWHYDSEAIFVVRKKLYFISKNRKAGQIDEWEAGAVLYQLNSQYTDRFNVLKKVDSNDNMEVVTGADLSPNGKRLAVLGYRQLWVFEIPRHGNKLLSGPAFMLPLDVNQSGQAEAVTWDDDETILVSNEGREVFSIRLSQIPPFTKM